MPNPGSRMTADFTLGILGPGTLGLSAAQWAAECGLSVRLFGRDLAHAERGVQALSQRWQVLERKGKLTQAQVQSVIARVTASELNDGLSIVDALLEALPEEEERKVAAWREIAQRLNAQALALTGSSALPVEPMARKAGLTGRLLGFHLFVPVRRMPALELVVPPGVDEPLVQRAEALGKRLSKRVVRVKDGPGYAAARMALALGAEAMRLLEEGVADAEGLDALMTGGYGHPVGPLALSDRVGLELRLKILTQLHESTHAERFKPPAILEQKVAQGALGQTSGQGFYTWPKEASR
jgi:3-hydroxybutyryl-CoA dehydrogenase